VAGFRQPWRFTPLTRRRAWLGTKTGAGGSPPSNTAPPVISGTLLVGQTLGSTTGAWTNSPTSYAYQWRRNGADIVGATSSIYTLTGADVGATITCLVTASNAFGSASAVSNALGPVVAIATRTLTAKVQVAFDQNVAGVFLIDFSGLDGPDGLAPDARFTGTFTDVTDDVDANVEVVFGSDDLAGAVQASTCEFDLIHPLDVGYWNPRNLGSVPNSVNPGFKEMRPVQISVNDGVTTWGLFFGFIRNAHFDAESGLCHVHCEDLLLWLSRVYPVIGATGPTTVGAAIGLILDAINWTDSSLRDLAAGDTIANFSADGTKTGVDLISDLLSADRGTVYVDPDTGVFTYRDRHYSQIASPVATLTNQLVELGADLDVDRIATRVTAQREGGLPQTAIDAEAEGLYGRGELSLITSPYLRSDADAYLLATDVLAEKKLSAPPVRAQVQNDDASTLQLQLTLRPLQAIDILEDLAGTSGTYTVQQIRQNLDVQGFYLETDIVGTYRDPALTPFRIDKSGLDGPDVLRY